MTDWRDLPAGRELDRLIAERLGWRVDLEHGDVYDQDGEFVPPDDRRTWDRNPSENELWSQVPEYSTDLNAATTLLAHFFWRLTGTPDMKTNEVHYYCTFDSHTDYAGMDTIHVYAPTVALAICRAWLTWIFQQ